MTFKIVELKSERIYLRPLEENDFENLYKVASDPLIWELHPQNDRYKKDVFKTFFEGAMQFPLSFAIIDLDSNEIMGSSRYYNYDEVNSSVAIGYTFLARKYWGGKYNTVLKKLMIDYAFEKVNTILFHVGINNLRSQKAVLKLGATLKQEIEFDYYGRKVPHFEYEILKKNWSNCS